MISLVLTLLFFFSFFFLAISLALSSVWGAVASLVFGSLLTIYFFTKSRSLFFKHVKAMPLREEEAFAIAVRQAIYRSGPEKIHFYLWKTSSPDPSFQVWVRSATHIDLIFSHGLMTRVHEKTLETVLFQDQSYADIRVQNRLYALSIWWDSLKGPMQRFRYWFVSFWLYPLERFLKIDKI